MIKLLILKRTNLVMILNNKINNKKGEKMDNNEKVIKAFADSEDPLNITKLSELSGVEKKEVDKIMKDLKKDQTIISPKRSYWTLK